MRLTAPISRPRRVTRGECLAQIAIYFAMFVNSICFFVLVAPKITSRSIVLLPIFFWIILTVWNTASWSRKLMKIKNGNEIIQNVNFSWSNHIKHYLFTFLGFIMAGLSLTILLFIREPYVFPISLFFFVLYFLFSVSNLYLAKLEYRFWKTGNIVPVAETNVAVIDSQAPYATWWTQDETRQEIRRR